MAVKIKRQKPRFDAETGERLPNLCPVCHSEEFFTNQILNQLGLVLCAHPQCGAAFNPLVWQLKEKAVEQKEAVAKAQEAEKTKEKESMSQEDFEALREKHKDVLES